MAVAPFKPKAAAPDPTQDQEVKAALKSIQRAETDRQRHRSRVSDCYKLALPWRHGFDATQPTTSSNLDEIFDSTAMTVIEDFAADMINTFTPMKAKWTELKPATKLIAGDEGMIRDALARYNEVIFAEMRRSTLYQALQECYLDLSVGTMGLCIKDIGVSEPIFCEAVPAPELLIERGVRGGHDGKWRKWPPLKGSEIKVYWPEATKRDKQPWVDDQEYQNIIDGCYRDWSTPTVERWVYLVLIGSDKIYREVWTGAGSCELIVGRWSRDSTTAWGIGPLYRTSPDAKVLNYIQEKELKALDKAADPITSYEDDGVTNVDNGIEPGMWIPRGQNSEAPEVIESKARFDVTFAKREDLVHNIKRAHYQDRPEQSGKTPPTATQWADEAAERARRMGTPATNLIHDWQYPIIRRFAYLLAKRGVLPKIELNGTDIALEPISPLLRAQEQEEVVRIDRFAEMIGARFGPQIAAVVIKVPQYATTLAQKMGVPANLVATEAELANAMAQFGSILGQVGGTAGKVAPQPVGPPP